MKNGEIREGDTLHFDGTGFYTGTPPNHFKINKFMLRSGFKWELNQVHPFNGIWVDQEGDSDPLTQDEAHSLYASKKRWWRFWL